MTGKLSIQDKRIENEFKEDSRRIKEEHERV